MDQKLMREQYQYHDYENELHFQYNELKDIPEAM